jgi:dienelactone hydrolase
MAKLMELTSNPAVLCQRAQAGLDALLLHPLCDRRTAAIGYCFGGLAALEFARSGANLAGAISVHGTLKTKNPAAPGAIKCKILVCHGALDPHVPMAQANTFIEEMIAAAPDWQLIAYGGAMHGFTHDSNWGVPGVAYNADADRRSKQAIQYFLSELF